jgi:membrane protein implicated in regulation of membrane protease activity
MQWIIENIVEVILIIGVVLLIVEVAVLGFSTFFLFFAGLAAVSTALIMWAGLVPETWLYALFSTAVFTLIYAALLWKRLSAMQQDVDTTRAKSDLIGHSFVLPEDVIVTKPLQEKPVYQFSGIDWRLDAQNDLVAGTIVEVKQADVGVLIIDAKQAVN